MDLADEAQALDAKLREEALAVHQRRSETAPPGNGICVDCDCAIEAKRLAAHPASRRCIDCQEDHERACR